MDDVPVLRSRSAALRRREIRTAWLAVVAGLLVPVVALYAVVLGWGMREATPQGWVLAVCGTAVFVVRLVSYLG